MAVRICPEVMSACAAESLLEKAFAIPALSIQPAANRLEMMVVRPEVVALAEIPTVKPSVAVLFEGRLTDGAVSDAVKPGGTSPMLRKMVAAKELREVTVTVAELGLDTVRSTGSGEMAR